MQLLLFALTVSLNCLSSLFFITDDRVQVAWRYLIIIIFIWKHWIIVKPADLILVILPLSHFLFLSLMVKAWN